MTIEEIANETGASVPTVYRILNGKTPVKNVRHRKIQSLLQQFGFLETEKKRLKKVLLVTDTSLEQPGHNFQFFKQLESTTNKMHIQLFCCDLVNLTETLTHTDVDGVILLTGCYRDTLPLPCVVLNKIFDSLNYSFVNCDDRLGLLKVFSYLRESGHQRIAFFSDYGDDLLQTSHHPRRKSISSIYHSLSLEFKPDYIYAYSFRPEQHFEVIKDAVNHFLSLETRPTALVLPGDTYALTFYQEFHANGLKIPDDISIFGFDDSEVCTLMTPHLSSVKKPFEEMVKAALAILEEHLNNPKMGNKHVMIEPELVIRKSTGAPP